MRNLILLIACVYPFFCFGAYSPTQNTPFYLDDRAITADGSSDVTTPIQAILNSRTNAQIVLRRNGTYRISSPLTIGPYHQIIANSATITNTSTNFTVRYFSPLAPVSGNDIHTKILIQDLNIRAKNGILLNFPYVTHADYLKQGTLRAVRIVNYNFFGAYSAGVDPNFMTTNVATTAELVDYGVGLWMVKCFNSTVENSYFESAGIGTFLDRSDVNLIMVTRFNASARFVEIVGQDNWGGKNMLSQNDFLFPKRIGGVYVTNTHSTKIKDNHFESYEASGQYIRTDNDTGTRIEGNTFANTTQTNLPMVSLAPQSELAFLDNDWFMSIPAAPVEFRTNFWGTFHDRLGVWRGLSRFHPVPDSPAVWVAPMTDYVPYLFNPTNFFSLGGLADDAFPWKRDPVLGNWAVKTNDPSLITQFPLQSANDRRFKLTLTGRSLGAVNRGFTTVDYFETGVSTQVLAASALFSASVQTNMEVRDLFFELPSTIKGNGYLQISFANNEAWLASMKLEPRTPWVFDSQGNMAIGTNRAPGDYKLQVVEGGIASSHPTFANSIKAFMSAIDTNAPNTNGPVMGFSRFTGVDQHNYLWNVFYNAEVGEWVLGFFADVDPAGDSYADTLVYQIRPNGQIAIGTNTPSYPLDIDVITRFRTNVIFEGDVTLQKLTNLVHISGAAPTNLVYVLTPTDTTKTNAIWTPLLTLLSNITTLTVNSMSVSNLYLLGTPIVTNTTTWTAHSSGTNFVVDLSAPSRVVDMTTNMFLLHSTNGVNNFVVGNKLTSETEFWNSSGGNLTLSWPTAWNTAGDVAFSDVITVTNGTGLLLMHRFSGRSTSQTNNLLIAHYTR